MRLILWISLISAAMALPARAHAQDFDKGLDAYARGDYPAALNEWWPLARDGDAEAHYYLGYMYAGGEGVRRDDAEAVKWFRKAGEQGVEEAQYFLGTRYESGVSVPQDYVRAHMWYNLAASRWPSSSAWQKMAARARDAVSAKMTPQQIAEGQQLAREWAERHAGR